MRHEDVAKLSDSELVAKTLADFDYYQFLIERYSSKLAAYIQKTIFVNNEDAEDILQEVFIKAFRNLNGFDASYKFSSWIYRITHNEAISFLRARKGKAQEYVSDANEDVFETIASEVDLENDVIRAISAEKIHEILNQLDEKYREVLILKFIEELDYNEISDVLMLSPGTVGSLISRAKSKFKTLMQQYG